tara:strand:+ start:511 stop:1383 length:873 start_codon:yes stop_codon:yes gene_type:complete
MKKILLPLMILVVTACSHGQKPIELIAETNPSRISPDYEATGNAEGVRAYIYGNHTLVQSKDSFKAWDSNNTPLKFEKTGNFSRSEYLLNDFYLQRGNKLAQIKRVFISVEETTPIIIEVTPEKEPAPEAIKHYPELEVFSLKYLNETQAKLDTLSNIRSTTGASLFNSQVKLNKLNELLADHRPVVFVNFGFGKTQFKPSNELVKSLLLAAADASEINLRGRTDSITASKADVWISKQRAENAKSFLVANGINPAIISVEYLAEGDFLLPPKSSTSKSVNRRVEIEVKP